MLNLGTCSAGVSHEMKIFMILDNVAVLSYQVYLTKDIREACHLPLETCNVINMRNTEPKSTFRNKTTTLILDGKVGVSGKY